MTHVHVTPLVTLLHCLNQISCLPLCFRGGLIPGDVIVKMNGQQVLTTDDIHEVLRGDEPLFLEIRRGNDDLLFSVYPDIVEH